MNCFGRFNSRDFWVMSPTSYRAAPPRTVALWNEYNKNATLVKSHSLLFSSLSPISTPSGDYWVTKTFQTPKGFSRSAPTGWDKVGIPFHFSTSKEPLQMAGDWIKLEHATLDKPEIIALADYLKIDQASAFEKCVRLWVWADQHTVNGTNLSVTISFLDRLTNCPGFSEGLVKTGWMKCRNGRISLPNFDRHNGQTAKTRALTKDRMKRQRDDQSVTLSSPEKRREEKKNTGEGESPPVSSKFVKPTIEEVEAYRVQMGYGFSPEAWMAYYNSNGWKVGKNPMKDWKAAVVSWEMREIKISPQKRFKDSESHTLQPDFIRRTVAE